MYNGNERIEIINEIKPIMKAIWTEASEWNCLNYQNLGVKQFTDLFKNSYGLKFEMQGFPEGLEAFISGMLCGKKIGINPYISAFRQNFTKMHEISHFIFDSDNVNKGLMFDRITEEGTALNRVELRAEISASMLMINDYAMLYMFIDEVPFTTIQNLYGMSQPALWYRMNDFLVDMLGFNYYSAQRKVYNYEAADRSLISKVATSKLDYILRNADSKTKDLIMLEVDNKYFKKTNGMSALIH